MRSRLRRRKSFKKPLKGPSLFRRIRYKMRKDHKKKGRTNPLIDPIKKCAWDKNEDGSLSWRSRIFIYGWSFSLSLILSGVLAFSFINIIKLFGFFIQDFNIDLSGSHYIFGMFFLLVFGTGIAIIRTADTKKQFEDEFNLKNRQSFELAVKLFFDKDNPVSQSAGLESLVELRNDPISGKDYKSKIDRITSGSFKIEKASLRKAKLENADLQGSDLTRADLRESNLRGANLAGAILQRTDLSGADLSNADLHSANLQRVILVRTILTQN